MDPPSHVGLNSAHRNLRIHLTSGKAPCWRHPLAIFASSVHCVPPSSAHAFCVHFVSKCWQNSSQISQIFVQLVSWLCSFENWSHFAHFSDAKICITFQLMALGPMEVKWFRWMIDSETCLLSQFSFLQITKQLVTEFGFVKPNIFHCCIIFVFGNICMEKQEQWNSLEKWFPKGRPVGKSSSLQKEHDSLAQSLSNKHWFLCSNVHSLVNWKMKQGICSTLSSKLDECWMAFEIWIFDIWVESSIGHTGMIFSRNHNAWLITMWQSLLSSASWTGQQEVRWFVENNNTPPHGFSMLTGNCDQK